jgi:hypothetical protein
MPSAESLVAELRLGIRAHYCSGWLDLETALTRTQAGGFVLLSRERAAEILRQPISVEVVKELTGESGQNITEGQIAARLAEVTA